jgi:hypothetical protein
MRRKLAMGILAVSGVAFVGAISLPMMLAGGVLWTLLFWGIVAWALAMGWAAHELSGLNDHD